MQASVMRNSLRAAMFYLSFFCLTVQVELRHFPPAVWGSRASSSLGHIPVALRGNLCHGDDNCADKSARWWVGALEGLAFQMLCCGATQAHSPRTLQPTHSRPLVAKDVQTNVSSWSAGGCRRQECWYGTTHHIGTFTQRCRIAGVARKAWV